MSTNREFADAVETIGIENQSKGEQSRLVAAQTPPAAAITTHNPETESALLGGLLLDRSCWDQVKDLLQESDFYRFEDRIIFGAISALTSSNLPVDVITVFEHLAREGKEEVVGGLAYLGALAQYVPNISNIRRYAQIVSEYSSRRTIQKMVADGRPVFEIAKFAGDSASRGAPSEWVPVVMAEPAHDLKKLAQEVRVNWVIENLVQAGKVGALVAAGGTGKTTLLLQLCVCIAAGRQFLGCNVKQGSTVVLTNDDPQEDMRAALAKVCQAMELSDEEYLMVHAKVRVVSLQGLGGTKTFTNVMAGSSMPTATSLPKELLQAVEGINDLVLVALDTLRQFSGGNSNDEQVIKLTIAGCTEFALRTGATVVLPHHTGKQNYRDGTTDMYAGSGSAAIGDNCRFVLVLQTAKWADVAQQVHRTGQEDGDPLVLRSARGSLLVKAPEPIFLYRRGFHIGTIAGKSLSRDQQLDKRDQEILAAVRSGAQTKNAVAGAVTGKKASLIAAVDNLLARQLLTLAPGSKKLMLTASGSRYIETQEDA